MKYYIEVKEEIIQNLTLLEVLSLEDDGERKSIYFDYGVVEFEIHFHKDKKEIDFSINDKFNTNDFTFSTTTEILTPDKINEVINLAMKSIGVEYEI